MHLPIVFLLSTLGASNAATTPTPHSPNGTCITKIQRRAWHTFTPSEKKAYIDAELCLMSRPATLGLPGTKNRFEELQSIHQTQSSITHGVGAFLPYHRLHMFAHETLLRIECNYTSAQPYWDEPLDAGNFISSPILDPITGFGGNGVGEKGCIVDGPFANYTNGLGPGYRIGDNCIYRFVNETLSSMAGREYVDWCARKKRFVEFWPCVEGGVHNGGHGGVGGKMLDPIASPGDPIFYLHHTWLDKVFWEWQALDLPARLSDIGGNTVQYQYPTNVNPGSLAPPLPGSAGGGPPIFMPPASAFPPADAMIPKPDSQRVDGNPGNVTTLGQVLNMLGVIPNATIGDVMDIGGPLLCYEYV